MKALAQKQRGIRVSARKEVIEQNRLRNGFERKLRKQLSALFAKIGRAAEREYVRHGRLLRSLQSIEPELYELLEIHYRAVINEFGLRIIRDTKEDTQFEFLVRDFLRVNGGVRIQQISETTRRQIMNAIQVADEEGLGVQVTGKRIFDRMSGSFSRYRAATIARTETHTAASYANDAVNRSLNIPNQIKRWVSVADLRTRPEHRAANGTEVPLDEDFVIGGVLMAYTGDPKGGAKNVINCRCVTLYITPEDEVIDETGAKPTARIPEQKPWGDATDEEIEFHNSSWAASTPAIIVRAIRKTEPVTDIQYEVDGAYAQGGRKIAMENKKGASIKGTDDAGVWRHEYGHHIDYNMGKRLYGSAYASRAVVKPMKKDKSEYSPRKKAQHRETTKANLESMVDDGIITDKAVLAFAERNGFTADDLKAYLGDKWADDTNTTARFIAAAEAKDFDIISYRLSDTFFKEYEGPNFADYLGAITNNRVGWGHSKAYYRRFSQWERGFTKGHSTEAMANYTALMGSENRESWRKLMEIFAPETTKSFDDLYEAIDDLD